MKLIAMVSLLLVLTACENAASKEYDVLIRAELLPETDRAKVSLRIDDASMLRKLDINVAAGGYTDMEANGELTLAGGRAIWLPPEQSAQLDYEVVISHKRDAGGYDALMTKDYALFRGDDLVPAIKVTSLVGAVSATQLEIILPEGWTSVEGGWPRDQGNRFIIDNPERRFDRPTGWFIAGELGIRRNRIGNTDFVVAAPRGSEMRRMDTLAFASILWPEMTKAFGVQPEKVLVVGGGDPLWRGGLSSPNSLYMHEQRPLLSENGTSTFVHELVHVLTRLSAVKGDDWIVEGLAEYYSFEFLYRVGAIPEARRSKILDWLTRWSEQVTTLKSKRSSGKVTARAALLFNQLDKEIHAVSGERYKLDDLVRSLMTERKVSISALRDACQQLLGVSAKTLQSPLLD